MSFQMIYDDWIVIQHYTKKDPVYGTLRQLHAYNIKTGQTVELFADSFEDNTYTNFQTAISVFDGNFYIVKHELDYSGTKFKPNGSKPLSDYEPETKSYLYEYNIEKNKMTEEQRAAYEAEVEQFYIDKEKYGFLYNNWTSNYNQR